MGSLSTWIILAGLGVTIYVQISSAAFLRGKLTEQLNTVADSLALAQLRLNTFDTRINQNTTDIEVLKEVVRTRRSTH